MPHGSLLLAAASGQTITFAPDLLAPEPAAGSPSFTADASAVSSNGPQARQATGISQPDGKAARASPRVPQLQQAAGAVQPTEAAPSAEALARQLLARPSKTTALTDSTGMDIAAANEEVSAGVAADQPPAPAGLDASLEQALNDAARQTGPVSPAADPGSKDPMPGQTDPDGMKTQSLVSPSVCCLASLSIYKYTHPLPPSPPTTPRGGPGRSKGRSW